MTEEMNLETVGSYNEGDRVTGKVTKIEDKSVTVEITGAPFDGVIPISELSSLHIEKAEDAVAEGDELELIIMKVEEETYVLSKRKVDAEDAWDSLVDVRSFQVHVFCHYVVLLHKESYLYIIRIYSK